MRTNEIIRRFNRKAILIVTIAVLALLTISGCGGGGGGGGSNGSGGSAFNPNDPNDPSPAPVGALTLTWNQPTIDVGGETLDDLAGYRIYYGPSIDNLIYEEEIAGDVTSYTFTDLAPGSWCFAVTAYNSAGEESDYSNVTCM